MSYIENLESVGKKMIVEEKGLKITEDAILLSEFMKEYFSKKCKNLKEKKSFLEKNDTTGYYLIAKTSEIPFTQATFENSKERVRLELAHEYADKQLGITK